MNMDSKLAQWEKAGLIDAATRERIAAFERSAAKPILLYALGGLGAVTVATGIISVVASNWDAIDKGAKLSADLVLGVALSVGIYKSVQGGQRWFSEILAGIFYGYVLASLALLGQIYQQGTPPHQALLIWSASTIPVMLIVRTPLLGFLWLAGLLWTHIATSIYFFENLHQSGTAELNFLVVSVAVSLFVYLIIPRIPWFSRHRPAVSSTWTSTLWFILTSGGFVSHFLYYVAIHHDDRPGWSLGVVALVISVLIAVMSRLYPTAPPRAILGQRLVLGFIALTFIVGTTATRDAWPAGGAVLQIILLALTAFTVLQLGRIRLFNVLTGFIALRILIMYFEIFGSMLGTGVALTSGGILTLFLAWIWWRKSPEMAARLGEGHEHAT